MSLNIDELKTMLGQMGGAGPRPPLLEFRAGLMTQSGTTVTADKRRGTIKFVEEDNMLHLQWFQRPNNTKELDLIIFRNQATWEAIPECKDGRVFLLRFKDGAGVRRFFWMQEPSDEKDAEYTKKINELISNPSVGGGAAATGGFGGMDQAALMSLMQGAAPPAAAATAAAAAAAGSTSSGSAAAAAAAPAAAGSPSLSTFANLSQQLQSQQESLTELFSPDILLPYLDSPELRAELAPHLPTQDGPLTAGDLAGHVRSAQLQQAVRRLGGILNSPQYGELITSLGLARYNTGGMGTGAFLTAIQKQADETKAAAPTPTPAAAETTETTAMEDEEERTGFGPTDAEAAAQAPAPAAEPVDAKEAAAEPATGGMEDDDETADAKASPTKSYQDLKNLVKKGSESAKKRRKKK